MMNPEAEETTDANISGSPERMALPDGTVVTKEEYIKEMQSRRDGGQNT